MVSGLDYGIPREFKGLGRRLCYMFRALGFQFV